MLEVEFSPGLAEQVSQWDRDAAMGLVARLPFPVAQGWRQVVEEEAPWDTLFFDGVETVLKYLSLVGASEYLAEGGEPDFDVNDALKPLGRGGLSLGLWLRLARACANRETEGERLLPGLKVGWAAVEEDCWASLRWEKRGLKGGKGARQGLLSTLVEARNKLYGHVGVSLSEEERAHASQQLRVLLWLTLERLAPVWEYDLCLPVPVGGETPYHRLRGVEDFPAIEPPPEVSEGAGYVEGRQGKPVPLHPLTLADSDADGEGTLLDRSAEVYLLNYLKRARVPAYVGLGGQASERPELAEHVESLFEGRRVWEKRQDLEVDQALTYALEKVDVALEYFRVDGLYDSERHVERVGVQETLDAYLLDEGSRLLFVTGGAGSGKTASLARWAERLQERRVPVLLLRGVELPEREAVRADRLELWIMGELGSAATLSEVLGRAVATEAGRFVVIVEGMNEFADMGRDLNGLWRSINELAERHGDQVALKLVVSARSDEKIPQAYLPNGVPPSYAEPEVYHAVEGRPYYRVGGLEPGEMAAVLQAYGVSADQAREAAARHGEELTAPLWLARYADGLLGGAELKKVTESGLTEAFVERRVSKSPELKSALTDLVRALVGKKTLAVTLEQLRKKDRKLADRLEADNRKLLHQLRSLELVRTHAVEGEDGRPELTISLGHDSIFQALLLKIHRKQALVQTGIMSGAVLTPGLAVVAAGFFTIRTSFGDLRERLVAFLDNLEQGIQDPALFARLEGILTDHVTAMQELLAFVSVRFVMGVSAVSVLACLVAGGLNLLLSAHERRSFSGESRMLFAAKKSEKAALRLVTYRVILPALVLLVLAVVGGSTGALPEDGPALLIALYLLVVTLFGPYALTLLEWRFAIRDECLRYTAFSPRAFRQWVRSVGIAVAGIVVITLALVWGLSRASVSTIPGVNPAVAARAVSDSAAQAEVLSLASDLDDIGDSDMASFVRGMNMAATTRRFETWFNEPLIDPQDADFVFMKNTFVLGLVGLLLGSTATAAWRRRLSRRAYPADPAQDRESG
ncbi:hypothetical protein ACFL5T_01725 [Gemmatimonadota bacterium]